MENLRPIQKMILKGKFCKVINYISQCDTTVGKTMSGHQEIRGSNPRWVIIDLLAQW